MPDFKYRAVLRNGKIIRGILTAKTKPEVIQMIKDTKMTPISITAKKIKRPAVQKKKIDFKKLEKAAARSNRRIAIEHKNSAATRKVKACLYTNC